MPRGSRPTVALSALVVLLAGCGGSDDDGQAQPTATAPAKAAATATPAPVKGRAVRFRASDRLRLHGVYFWGPTRKSTGVGLVHRLNGGPDQWAPLIPYLHARYAALAYQSRENGKLDERLLTRDLVGALRRQSGVDPKRVAVVGASIGATAAAFTAGTRPGLRLRARVGLSPAPVLEFPRGYRPHDVLLIA